MCFCDRMVQLIVPAIPSDHLDLFKLPDRRGDGHVFLPGFHLDHLLFKEVVYPVAAISATNLINILDNILRDDSIRSLQESMKVLSLRKSFSEISRLLYVNFAFELH